MNLAIVESAKNVFVRFGLLVTGFVVGCTNVSLETTLTTGSVEPRTYPYRIVATVGMVADIVREVAGDKAGVQSLMGAGVDPHLYKATRDDVVDLQAADFVFYSGLMLEGRMGDVLVKLSRSKPVVAVTEKLPEEYLLEPDNFGGHFDPHVWMDVSAWSKCVEVVGDALAGYDPQNETAYRERVNQYKAKLAALHEYGKNVIASIPANSRVLVTSHDAFNYLGRAYGLEVAGVQGISTESEAGLQRINGLVDMLVEKKVQAVFIETSVSAKSIQALIEGARSRNHNVKIGGELFSDAMGEAGTYEGSYEGMLDHNFTVITRALGGDAPERGFQGRLAEMKQ
jgi:manganese/zinc/iron transport system substrate-binding protein